MRRYLLAEKQPFGKVKNEVTMRGKGKPKELTDKHPGSLEAYLNNGYDQMVAFGDKNPEAHEEACRHNSNPFHWVGEHYGRYV